MTMQQNTYIHFDIEKDDWFEMSSIEFEGKWNCMFLPRIGDTLLSSLLIPFIDHQKFFNNLKPNQKKEWTEWIEEEIQETGISGQEAAVKALREWLDDLDLKVKDVYWGRTENDEIKIYIYL